MRGISLFPSLVLLLCSCGSGAEVPPAFKPAGSHFVTDTTAASSNGTPNAPPSVAPAEAPTASESSRVPAAALKPRIPLFNATCGNGLEVHANEGGPVFINGEETRLNKFNDNYFEASRGRTTISISFRPDGSLSLSFSGPNRANGICTLN